MQRVRVERVAGDTSLGTVSVGRSKAFARPGAAITAPRRAMRRESTGPSLTMHTPVADVREEAARCEALSGGAEHQRWGDGEIAGGVAGRGAHGRRKGD